MKQTDIEDAVRYARYGGAGFDTDVERNIAELGARRALSLILREEGFYDPAFVSDDVETDARKGNDNAISRRCDLPFPDDGFRLSLASRRITVDCYRIMLPTEGGGDEAVATRRIVIEDIDDGIAAVVGELYRLPIPEGPFDPAMDAFFTLTERLGIGKLIVPGDTGRSHQEALARRLRNAREAAFMARAHAV